MGQKTNPISLRLNINRNFDSCWFQDESFQYGKLLQQDLKIREYLKSLFNFVGLQTARISIQIFPKKLILHYFFHDTDKKSKKLSDKKYKTNHSANRLLMVHPSTDPSFKEENKIEIESPENKLSLTTSQYPKALFWELNTIENNIMSKFSISRAMRKKEKNFQKLNILGCYNDNLVIRAARNVAIDFITPYAHEFRHSISTPTVHDGHLSREGAKREQFGATREYSLQDIKTDFSFVKFSTKEKKRFFLRLLFAYFYSLQHKNIFQIRNFIKFSPIGMGEWSRGLHSTRHDAKIDSLLIQNVNNANEKLKKNQNKLNSYIGAPCTIINSQLERTFVDSQSGQFIRKNLPVDIHLKHIESTLVKNFKMNTLIIPIKVSSRALSAQLICLYICQRLQQNVPFRQIYKQLLVDLGKGISKSSRGIKSSVPGASSSLINNSIQGMRIVCSGRIGGVEMAKVESKKYGQTSLHVFSSKIDFAVDQAYTLFGLIGVKVWISFRDI